MRRLPVWLALLLAGATAVRAAQDDERAKFESLVREIGVLREELDRFDQQEWGIAGRLERLSMESALRRRELARLRIEREEAARSLEEARRALDRRSAELAADETELARRLRELYRMGRQREVRMLLALKEPADLLRGLAYLDFLARRQAGAVETARQTRTRLDAQRRALSGQTQSLEALARRETEKAAQVEASRAQAAELLDSIRKDQATHREAIAEISRAAAALEEAILAGGAGMPPAAVIDVGRLKGALEWPVVGEVSRPFGEIRHPRFGTSTPHPGVDFTVQPAAPIRAILGGRVLYSRRLNGYGNTVILDHSGHYLSVYARAAALLVGEGQEVVAGEAIGTAQDESFDGGPPTVYFEFRREGKPEDPALWLKRKPGRRREEQR